MRKILLNKKRSKVSVNNTNIIPLELKRDVSLLHEEIMTETLDAAQIYNDEKNSSTKHRFIFTLNPMCTNVLFNRITEVVHNEGGNDAIMLKNNSGITSEDVLRYAESDEAINRVQAIRNTEYSNEVFNMTYHCGADIFNNHLLRSNENVSVQKRCENSRPTSTEDGDNNTCIVYYGDMEEDVRVDESAVGYMKDPFNTIADYSRTYNGENVKTLLPNAANNYTYYGCKTFAEDGCNKGYVPLYIYDTIKNFNNAYNDGIKRESGWIGFRNTSTFHIPIKENNGKEYYVDRCMNNQPSCKFIDMAPERDLFYFTPKFNKKRNRLEYNWDYCLTYPYLSEYNDGKILIGKGKGLPLVKFENGSYYNEYISNSGLNFTMFRSAVKHNLSIGDTINLKIKKNDEDEYVNARCSVVALGDDNGKFKGYYFSLRKADFEDFIEDEENKIESMRFAKLVYGYECEYYFRVFKMIEQKLNSYVNKLAFAKNIYGDECSQLVFTDDIDVSKYIDNRKRPLTEIFLTLIKTNKGYKKWYDENICNDAGIEASHVFGKITSGLDLPSYVNEDMPSIRKQHNISITEGEKENFKIKINKSSEKLEDDITKDKKEFYGDLIEFNPVSLIETPIEMVLHRFNTAQRETRNKLYNTIYYDEIRSDIYDFNSFWGDDEKGNTKIKLRKINEGYANLAPEGYIYQPHHRITIGRFDESVNQLSDTTMQIKNPSLSDYVDENGKTITNGKIIFENEVNYGILPGDLISLVNKGDNYVWCYFVDTYIFDAENKKYVCTAIIDSNTEYKTIENADNIENNYIFFKHNLSVPYYAYMIPDGTGRHLWRDLKKPSEYTVDDSLYSIPFTNGAFYHHATINFPVRRQDPFGRFEMFVKDENGDKLLNNFDILATELETANDEQESENTYTSCL